jgi:hypothetical protein
MLKLKWCCRVKMLKWEERRERSEERTKERTEKPSEERK